MITYIMVDSYNGPITATVNCQNLNHPAKRTWFTVSKASSMLLFVMLKSCESLVKVLG